MKINSTLLAFVLSAALTFGGVMAFSGCAPRVNHITNLPPGVSEQSVKNWYQAVGALSTIESMSHSALTATVLLHDSGGFANNEAYEKVLRSLGKIDELQVEAARFLQSVPNDWSQPTQAKIKDYVTKILTEFQTINAEGLTGIKNPDALKTINGFISNGIQAVNVVLSLIQAFHQ